MTNSPTARRLVLVPAVALLLSGTLAACGSDDDSGGDTTSAAEPASTDASEPASTDAEAGAASVDIVSVPDGFGPSTITVAVGTEVTWTNTDGAPHTSTAEDGSWDSSSLAQGESFSFTASEAGTFAYFCAIHPSMTGELIVE